MLEKDIWNIELCIYNSLWKIHVKATLEFGVLIAQKSGNSDSEVPTTNLTPMYIKEPSWGGNLIIWQKKL